MSLLVVGLILGCGVGFSILDIVRKSLATRMRAETLLFGLTGGAFLLFLGWVSLGEGFYISTAYLETAAFAIIFNTAANYYFIRSVEISPLSLTIPYLAFSPIFTVFFAMPFGEYPGLIQLLGIILVVVGALFLHPRQEGSLWSALRKEKGSLYMMLVSLLWALSAPLDKQSILRSSPAFHGAVLNGALVVFCLVFLAKRRELHEIRKLNKVFWPLLIGIFAGAIAFGMQLYAVQFVQVSIFEAAKRAIGLIFAIIFGFLIFKEELTWGKVLAGLIMVAGVVLVLVPFE